MEVIVHSAVQLRGRFVVSGSVVFLNRFGASLRYRRNLLAIQPRGFLQDPRRIERAKRTGPYCVADDHRID